MKKYEFTGETKVFYTLTRTVTLHRIRATVNFGQVVAGEVGGWIEKEKNLSHRDKAWVYGDAKVYGDAMVGGDVRVYGDTEVYGNALVYGKARVYGNALVYGKAEVYGKARVYGNAEVYGNARVCNDAEVYGDALVCGDARVCGNAEAFSTNHILVIGNIGSRNDFTTFYRDKDNDITVQCGCFLGKIDEFLGKVAQTHGESKHALVYRTAVELAKLQIDLTGEAPKEDNQDA